jgi:hypothetical protein
LPFPCELYTAGHTVHWIQVFHSAGEPHRSGRLIAAEDNKITVDFGDEIKEYRNHEIERLVEIIGIGGTVRICQRFVILQGGGTYCFSFADADEPWVPCDNTPLTSFDAGSLAERLTTHGGFDVPGRAVLEAIEAR